MFKFRKARKQTITVRIIGDGPHPGCPYCGMVDPKPSTHIAEGRCK